MANILGLVPQAHFVKRNLDRFWEPLAERSVPDDGDWRQEASGTLLFGSCYGQHRSPVHAPFGSYGQHRRPVGRSVLQLYCQRHRLSSNALFGNYGQHRRSSTRSI